MPNINEYMYNIVEPFFNQMWRKALETRCMDELWIPIGMRGVTNYGKSPNRFYIEKMAEHWKQKNARKNLLSLDQQRMCYVFRDTVPL